MQNPGLRRRQFLKRAIGERAYGWLRFVHRLPVYRRAEQLRQRKLERDLPVNALPLDDHLCIFAPDNLLCYSIFASQATEANLYRELQQFIRLTEGCARMLDIGASAGYFSAVFAQTCPIPAKLASIEPEAKSFNLLEETRQLNSKEGLEWSLFNCGIAATDRVFKFKVGPGLGATVDDADPDGVGIDCMSLPSVCQQAGFVPDVIKIDIESYEYEVLVSSAEFLAEAKPRLHLEIHSPGLRSRGMNPEDLVRCLDDLGYRAWGERQDSRVKLSTLLHQYEVQRFDLSVE